MLELSDADGKVLPSLTRGAAIGRYVVLGLVGRGAMGEVYAAYDPELDRKVAVKLLHARAGTNDLSAAAAKSRLLREAQAMARLSHPNVIVVHDVGSFGERVFVAMEFVDGHTVGYWLLAAKRSSKEVLRVFMDAGRGLAAAHASRLVHRDFKVENVMIGSDGQVRVMDFGLARMVADPLGDSPRYSGAFSDHASSGAGAIAPTAPEDLMATRILVSSSGPGAERAPSVVAGEARVDVFGPRNDVPRLAGADPSALTPNFSEDLTQTGAIIGTPAYMAPEQFEGEPADERSDQFSFCVALYESLYGQRPFAGKSVVELSENVRRGRMSAAPDSARVPSWLRRVVLRGLRTNPTERWESMDALLDALQKDPSVRWRKWAIVAGAVAGIGGIGVAARQQGARESRPTCQVPADRFSRVWEPKATPGSRRAAIANAFQRSGHSYAADALAGMGRLLDGYVEAWSAMYTESCEATNKRGEQSAEVLDLRMSCLRDRWNEMRALSDVLADPSDGVVVNAVKAAAALTPIDRCADLRTLRAAVPPPHDPAVRARVEAMRTKLATAKALHDAGRFANALTAAEPLVSAARAIGYPPILADALYRQAEVQLAMGRLSEADVNFDEAIWTAEAARYDEVVAMASIEQIYVAGAQASDMPRGRRWFRQAEAFLARMEGHELLRSWMDNNFGAALESHGDLEPAAARYLKALEVKERILGKSHPDVAFSLTNLASVLTALGRPEEALALSDRGVQIMEQTLGPEHPDTAAQWANRAEILNQLGRYAEARRDAERALPVWEKELGPQNANLVFFLGPLGEARLGLGEPAAAATLLERGLALAEQHAVRSEIRKLRFVLARALWQSGQDRPRAIRLGLLAASPVPTSDDASTGRASFPRDTDLQRRAADWVVARQADMTSPSRVARRFRGSSL